jgi:Lon protease-like protein
MDEKISLFPLPGAVSLPYSVKPLQIYEPRYLAMIKDSLAKKRRVGLAHTKKLKSSISRHEHYEAHEIFSAGFVELIDTLQDGRLIIQIKMDQRYKIVDEIQQVPYKVVRAETYMDIDDPLSDEQLWEIRNELDQIFIDLIGVNNEGFIKYVKGSDWQGLSFEEYSFAIYSLVLFEADEMQKVLELTSSGARMIYLQDALLRNSIP